VPVYNFKLITLQLCVTSVVSKINCKNKVLEFGSDNTVGILQIDKPYKGAAHWQSQHWKHASHKLMQHWYTYFNTCIAVTMAYNWMKIDWSTILQTD